MTVITYGSDWKPGGTPLRMPRAWNVNGIPRECAEEVGADEAQRRSPEREDDERNRDPPSAAGDAVDPLRRDRQA